MTAIYPGAEYKPIERNFSHNPMVAHLGLVLHVQVGNGSLAGWFNNPQAEVSSHWWVGVNGAVEQYVDAELTAWAQAEGNATYLSVETEGEPNVALTVAQIDALAGLYRWCHDTFSIPFAVADTVGQRGFAWHGMGGESWGNHPDCPSPVRLAARAEILQKAQGAAIPPAVPGPVTRPPVTPPAPVSTIPAYPGRLIRLTDPRMVGNDIHIWQTQMLKRGWKFSQTDENAPYGAVDSTYGPKSEAACIAFQHEKGLTVDGIVGSATWAATWASPVT